MHERYAYGALIFLMLLLVERPVRALAIGFAIVFTLNLLAAVPPTPAIGELLPVDGALSVGGVAGDVGRHGVLPVVGPSTGRNTTSDRHHTRCRACAA